MTNLKKILFWKKIILSEEPYKELEANLKQVRKRENNFSMEVESERIIDEFYNNHVEIDNNTLSIRLQILKDYDANYKIIGLPILISVVFNYFVSLSLQYIIELKKQSIDVIEMAYIQAKDKLGSMFQTEKVREAIVNVDHIYKITILEIWVLFFIVVLLMLVIAFSLYNIFSYIDHIRYPKRYQSEYEIKCLENILKKKRYKGKCQRKLLTYNYSK